MSIYKRHGATTYSYDFVVRGHRFSGTTEKSTQREAQLVGDEERARARKKEKARSLDNLTLFGLAAVTAMLVSYTFEERSHWYVLAFAGSCALGSAYGFLQGAWPFGAVEAIWSVVALRRWIKTPRELRSVADDRA